jgi:hypothetical protein
MEVVSMTEDEYMYEVPRLDVLAEKEQLRKSGMVYICLQCKTELSVNDLAHNFAQCLTCRNPKIIAPPNLHEVPVEALSFVPGGSRRRFFYYQERP